MPNFSGVWTLQEQFEAITEGNWTGIELFELYSWGDNGFGQLGQNTSITLDRSSPVQVGSLTTWDKVAGGLGLHSAAIKSDGTLWMWL
jgi:alpha-tubulin suppressor-like RCC1 family protein